MLGVVDVVLGWGLYYSIGGLQDRLRSRGCHEQETTFFGVLTGICIVIAVAINYLAFEFFLGSGIQ